MGLDIYISRKTASGKECLIHWHKFGPLAEWFKEKIYNGTLDCCNQKRQPKRLFVQDTKNNFHCHTQYPKCNPQD